MSRDFLTLEELVQRLGRDRRQIEKLVNRGVIPGRRIGGDWRFNEIEITHWLEQELRGLDDQGLAQFEQSQQSSDLTTVNPISTFLHPETCEVPLDAGTRPAVLQALIEVAGRTWQVWDPASILKAVKDREDVMSTGFENGVAIPHPRNPLPDALGNSVIAFGRTLSGLPFGAPGRAMTDLFFLVLARDSATHLQILARLGRILNRDGFVQELRRAETGRDAYDLMVSADEQTGVWREVRGSLLNLSRSEERVFVPAIRCGSWMHDWPERRVLKFKAGGPEQVLIRKLGTIGSSPVPKTLHPTFNVEKHGIARRRWVWNRRAKKRRSPISRWPSFV